MPSCQTVTHNVTAGSNTFSQAYDANYQQNYSPKSTISVDIWNSNWNITFAWPCMLLDDIPMQNILCFISSVNMAVLCLQNRMENLPQL